MYQELEKITLRDLISFSCITNNRFFSIFNRAKIIVKKKKKNQSTTFVTLFKIQIITDFIIIILALYKPQLKCSVYVFIVK